MVAVIIGVLGGLIAMGPWIVSKRPDAKDMLDKVTPYTGWIGVVLFGWGVWEIISSVLGLGLLAVSPLTWIFWLATGVGDLLCGFLLGFGLISKYALSKNAEAQEKGQRILGKLAPFQMLIGAFEIVMSVLYAVWLFVL